MENARFSPRTGHTDHMAKKRRILFAVLLVAVLGGSVWLAISPDEPVYQGKTLTNWLRQYAGAFMMQPAGVSKEEGNESKVAILHIGTNAFPTLLAMAASPESDYRGFLAASGFAALGPEGKDAVPSLIALTKSRNRDVRMTAIECLGFLGPAGKDVIPQLVQYLKDNNTDRFYTITVLAHYGEIAKPAVPALRQYLNDENQAVRSATTNAIKRIDPETSIKPE